MNTALLKGLLVASLLMSIVSCGGNNEKKVTRKIEVTGSAEMEFVPNEIYITFLLKEYLKGGEKVKLDAIKSEFVAICKNAGIKNSDISVASYSGNERWDYYWYSRRKRDPDFMGSISYSVKVSSTSKMDKLVNALNEDALDNFQISRTTHSDIEKFRKQVKTKAMLASKNKAKYLAKSVGEEVGETLLIQEVENSFEFYGRGGGGGSYSSNISNVKQMYFDASNLENETPSFKKIKLRYEIKAEYRLK